MGRTSEVATISAQSHSLVSIGRDLDLVRQIFPTATNVVLTSVSLQLNGTGDGSIKSIVNKQYNSPVGIYSEETIAETLSAQAEVLAGGVLG